MSTDEFTAQLEQLLALPPATRMELAYALLDSVDEPTGGQPCDDARSVEIALRRSAELSAGVNVGRSHEEIMDEARRIIECD
jgi:hypothetical protein